MSYRDELIEKTKSKLDDANAEIQRLQDLAAEQAEEARAQTRELVDELQDYRDRAREKIEQLQTAGDAAVDDLRLGAENAWNSLKLAVGRARERF